MASFQLKIPTVREAGLREQLFIALNLRLVAGTGFVTLAADIERQIQEVGAEAGANLARWFADWKAGYLQ